MNIFANYDWQIGWDTDYKPEDLQKWTPHSPEAMESAVTTETTAFKIIETILHTPYETLVAAHNEASKIITS